jgi:uncharacterized protein YbjT (DUF2867 family)
MDLKTNTKMNKILLAGATGTLGSYLAKELVENKFETTLLVRNTKKIAHLEAKIVKAELTKPETLKGVCHNIDVVISSVGITRQKDKLTYMDVDFQANMNLLNEAVKSGVKKFIYLSVINGEELKHIKICEAKEKFVDALKASGLDYQIVRPNGFYTDLKEILDMAKSGRAYLFGDGSIKLNPIHPEDLAKFCVENIDNKETNLEIGGPETFSQKELAELAFEVLDKKTKITYIPNWLANGTLSLIKLFTKSTFYGPIEFFITAMQMEAIGPKYGTLKLKEYFLNNK